MMDPVEKNKDPDLRAPASNNQPKNTPEIELQDDTVKSLLAKARKDAEMRAQSYARGGLVLPNIPAGTKEELSSGIKFEPIIQENPVKEPPSTKFSAVPIEESETETTNQNPDTKIRPEHDPLLKNLRTYQGDMAEALKNQNASTLSIAMAAKKKREARGENIQTPAEKTKERKNTWLAIGSAFLLIIGLAILGGLYYVHVENQPLPIAESPKTLIGFDKSTEILFQGLTRDKFMSLMYDIKDHINVPLGQINYINIVKRSGATPETTKNTPINGKDFIGLIKARVPPILSGSMNESFMLGTYQGKLSGIFILVGISSYENAFDGMLRWESGMWNDLGGLISPNPAAISNTPTLNNIATTTASSTKDNIPIGSTSTTISVDTNKVISNSSFISTEEVKDLFIDKVISNKDTRVLQNKFGETVLVYAFVTKDLLLISSNEETFKAILDKAFAAKGR